MQNTPLTTAQENALSAWIRGVDAVAVPGASVWWKYPDEDRLTKPFVVISVSDDVEPEHERPAMLYDSLDTWEREYHEVFMFTVKYYANDGSDYIRDVIKSADTTTLFEALELVDLGIRYRTDHVVAPRMLSTKHEYIEMVSFVIVTNTSSTEEIGEIQTVEVNYI